MRRTEPAAGPRWLAYGVFLLAGGFVANSILGPFLLEVIKYRFTDSLLYQGIGLDAVALFGAAPVAVAAGALVLRGHRAGPVLVFVPATFGAYMFPQYMVGPDYVGLAGNNEQFFLLHLALFILSLVLVFLAWSQVDRAALVPASAVADRRRSLVLFGLVAFIGVGRWLPALADITGGAPFSADFIENPTSFLLIGLLDLGLVAPAALAAGIALRFGAEWGREAAYAVIGWFALVPAAVAAMAVVMDVNGDPNATTGTTVLMVTAGVVFTVGAALLYRPMFRADSSPAPLGEDRVRIPISA